MAPFGSLITLMLIYSSFHYVQPTKVWKDNNWDLLIYTQQWPTTACNEWKEKNPSHKCSMPSQGNTWSVHGIWPTKYGSMGPFFCNSSAHFDPEAIKPIEKELTEHWTNIDYGTSTYSFWAHEWTKHGTCAAILDAFNSEFKYFSKGLEYLNTYNLSTILSEADIVPSVSKTYDVVDIVNALRVRLGVNPVVECRKEQGKSNMIEIRICMSKKLELMDCDGVVHLYPGMHSDNVLTNCDRNQGVLYLPYSSPSNLNIVQWYKLVTWLHWFTL
ncbi:ribonuclease Oy-like [Choristoneura fumiferana]|uniref:ribonuclease Oy-like n=1 Tax=Choristoneura fumiferana TaxID=7141 RepID=UPI003D154C38